MAKYIYKLAEIVMFVLTSNPAAINRMKARKGGFFKGHVVKETLKEVWIEPMNKEFTERLKKTSFFTYCGVAYGKKAFLLPDVAIRDEYFMNHYYNKYGKKNIAIKGIVIVPKKQVEHFYGQRRRLNDAMEALANSDLVKKGQGGKKKAKKSSKWTYNL